MRTLRFSGGVSFGFAALLFLVVTFSGGVSRAENSPSFSTLDRIRETGVLRIGYGDTPPFSYPDADGTVVGYSIDICKKVADEIRAQIGLGRIEIEYVPRTPSNRVQLLNSGAIDIECNASTNTEERRRSVAFATSHFFASTRYVSLAKNRLRRIGDLEGRSVSVALGTVNVGQINKVNRERKLNLLLMPVDSLQAAFDLVTQERVSAFAMDDVLLSAMIAESGNPDVYTLSDDVLTEPEPYGFMMRLGDREFEAAVNAALRKIYASPEMPELYERWFNRPIPGRNINLQLPMSGTLKQALARPE